MLPARKLDNKTIKNALTAFVLPQALCIATIAIRASWHVDVGALETARLNILKQRECLDEKIAAQIHVQWFFSCISGTETKSRKVKDGAERDPAHPGIAYFIGYVPTADCTENTFLTILHKHCMDISNSEIKTRPSKETLNPVHADLCAVIKDHNSTYAKTLLKESQEFLRY